VRDHGGESGSPRVKIIGVVTDSFGGSSDREFADPDCPDPERYRALFYESANVPARDVLLGV